LPWNIAHNPVAITKIAKVYWWVVVKWESAIVNITENKILNEEKRCFTPSDYSVIIQWQNTQQKDQIIYQGLLKAFGLTKFDNTDNFKSDRDLKRWEAAKMFVEFAKNVLCREKIKEYKDNFNDILKYAKKL
jgi:hypothetical protein